MLDIEQGDVYKRQEDGWLRTGDLGYYNQAGYLYIVDRKKDMINRGGEKICSFDIENVLHTLPYVAEAAVVAVPDEKYKMCIRDRCHCSRIY